jgi:hypothetical protein
MIQSMMDSAEIVAAVPALGLRAEDARAIGLSLFLHRRRDTEYQKAGNGLFCMIIL